MGAGYIRSSENLMAARTRRVSFAYDPLGRPYQTDATASAMATARDDSQFSPNEAPA